MEFHQNTSERFAEKIITILSTKFDGKVMNSPDMTIELMIKSIPYEPEDDIIDISPTPEKVINTIKPKDTSESSDEPQPETPINNENVDTPVIDDDGEDTPVIDDNEDNSVNNTNEEIFKDDIDDNEVEGKPKKKKKKEKKAKKTPDPNKPKRQANAYIRWKTHPDNIDIIESKSIEINEETGEQYGKTKAAGFLWKQLDKEEQVKWKPTPIS
uniref:Uncharacterized protein n=1 Tax=viral metagenome TaxID=1070528 RepID=A0A6C0C6B4_9ZZZZ